MHLPVLVAPEIPGSQALVAALTQRGRTAELRPQDNPPPARGVCIHLLPPGLRQVPTAMMHWLHGGLERTLVLVAQEPLTSPVIHLHQDKIVLVAEHDPVRLSAVVEAAAASHETSGPFPTLYQTQRGPGWRMLVADESHFIAVLPDHATAVLGAQPATSQHWETALKDPPTARLARLAADSQGSSVIQLDTVHHLWLATMPAGAPMQMVLAGPGRIPGAMAFTAPGNLRLRAHAGDVLLATWQCALPSTTVLGRSAALGAEALLELCLAGRGQGAVLALEARP